MSEILVRYRCGHTRMIDLYMAHISPTDFLQAEEAKLCPACSKAKEENDRRRFVSCPE